MSIKIIRNFCIILILLIPIQSIIAHDAANTNAPTTATDYFDYITLFSDGKITRFTEMPIKVYISPVIRESQYLPELRYAMNKWATAVEGLISFEETENSENADIRVSSGEHSLISYLDTRLGTAELTRHNDSTQTIISNNLLEQEEQPTTDSDEPDQHSDDTNSVDFRVEIILILESDGTIQEMSEQEIRTVCLHEFGHAIGLWGHSPHHEDINHTLATVQHLSERDINTLIRLYNTPLNTPQHDKVITLLKKELEVKTKHPRIHYLLGSVYFDKGDTSSAIQSFQESLRLDPNYQIAAQKLLQTYQKTGNQTLAIELLKNKIVRPDKQKTQRDNAVSYNHLGVLHYRQGEIDDALHAFEKALELSPHHKPTKRNLYSLYLEKTLKAVTTKSLDHAAIYTEKLLELEPENAITFQLLGKSYAQIGEITKAIDCFQKALKYDPDDKPTKHNLAQSYVSQGLTLRNEKKWDSAIKAYRHALKLEPTLQIAAENLIDAVWQKANAYREEGKNDEAIEAYLELQKLVPNEPDISSLLGGLYLKKQNFPAAVLAFNKTYTLSPDNPQAKQNLIAVYQQYAQHLTKLNRHSKAIEQLKKAVDLFPAEQNLRLNLAHAYKNTRDYDHAKSELEYILENHPDNKQAKTALLNMQVRLGNTLMKQRKYKEATTAFEAIPDSQKDINIYNMIGYLYSVRSKHIEAVSAFESTLGKDPSNDNAYQNIRAIESQLVAMLFEASPPEETASETQKNESAKAEIDNPKVKTIKAKLLQVQCSLAVCLINRRQPKNALLTFQKALNLKPDSPELKNRLVETGRKLANIYYSRNDKEKRDKIIQWVEPLDSNFKESLTQ